MFFTPNPYPMTETQFWQLIDETRKSSQGNTEGQALMIEEHLLEQGTEQEVLDFAQHLQNLLADSYTAYLWGVSYLVNWDDSPESFEAFRAWLILQGKKLFDAVQENGDVLVDYLDERAIDEDFRLESPELLALPFAVWSEITEKDPEEMPLERNPVDLKGKLWEEDEELEVEFPLLFELVGWEDVEEEEEKL